MIGMNENLHTQLTRGEFHLPGYQTQVHDGELRELQLVHSSNRAVALSLPEEHYVIRSVSVCKRENKPFGS